ncbi:MAG: transglutaminase family protein [Hyphomonadaceae bacterium]
MLYDVGLLIHYKYTTPAAGGRHVLYMTPANLDGQRAITSLLDITPAPDERSARTDFYGNTVVEVAFHTPHSEVAFRLRARVERNAPPAGEDRSGSRVQLAAALRDVRSLEGDSPHHFLANSSRVRAQKMFRDYALAQIDAESMTTLEFVETIGGAINRDMAFEPGSTQVDTPPEEAFVRRRGVCQDFTHIMIACLRSIGVPAAYVSGFLRTIPPKGQPRLEGADAMHAWVRAWCGPKMGWVDYDPTNGVRVGDQHIVVACGRDYGDVAPVRGVVRTSGDQNSKQAVDVAPLED